MGVVNEVWSAVVIAFVSAVLSACGAFIVMRVQLSRSLGDARSIAEQAAKEAELVRQAERRGLVQQMLRVQVHELLGIIEVRRSWNEVEKSDRPSLSPSSRN